MQGCRVIAVRNKAGRGGSEESRSPQHMICCPRRTAIERMCAPATLHEITCRAGVHSHPEHKKRVSFP